MNKDHENRDVKKSKGNGNGTTGKAFANKSLEERGKIVPPTENVPKRDGDGKDKMKR